MGIAQTGTGKTLAFGIPLIQRLAQHKGKMKGLIILPTRELALQVNKALAQIGTPLGMKTAILIGGESMGKQFKMLAANPEIIIATPGRLIDHLENHRIKLTEVGILVLDEADRMLDMGFAPQIDRILRNVSKVRQTMLFSATMPEEIVKIAKSYMATPLRVEIAPSGTAIDLVTHELFFVSKSSKMDMLENILLEYKGSVLVFSRTKHGAKKIAKTLRDIGHTAAEIHSNRTLNQRLDALEGFKLGRYRVLVATDIAARGIDVVGIQLVVNFDLPEQAEDYVHRIGRTGRAGLKGHAVSFATHDQRGDVQKIERLTRLALPVSKPPSDILAKAPASEPSAKPGRSGRRNDSRESRHSERPRPAKSESRSYGKDRFATEKPKEFKREDKPEIRDHYDAPKPKPYKTEAKPEFREDRRPPKSDYRSEPRSEYRSEPRESRGPAKPRTYGQDSRPDNRERYGAAKPRAFKSESNPSFRDGNRPPRAEYRKEAQPSSNDYRGPLKPRAYGQDTRPDNREGYGAAKPKSYKSETKPAFRDSARPGRPEYRSDSREYRGGPKPRPYQGINKPEKWAPYAPAKPGQKSAPRSGNVEPRSDYRKPEGPHKPKPYKSEFPAGARKEYVSAKPKRKFAPAKSKEYFAPFKKKR